MTKVTKAALDAFYGVVTVTREGTIRDLDKGLTKVMEAMSVPPQPKLDNLLAAAGWLLRNRSGIEVAIAFAHMTRTFKASPDAREDDRLFRADVQAAFDKLSDALQPQVEPKCAHCNDTGVYPTADGVGHYCDCKST
jgi:hypothetical protein